jgi:2-phospho-L-lactate/phosphoenolpyruvate guanylyltransferase
MRTLAVLPVKSFGRAKQRLGSAVAERPRLAEAMSADVLEALGAVHGLDGVVVVTAEPLAARAGAAAGAQVVDDPYEGGQSAAATLGVAAAVRAGAERVLLVPGDCPALDPDEVEALLGLTAPVVIVPDRHGAGTNALLLTPPDVLAPSFGDGSFARHAALARGRVKVAAVRSLGLDVDTPDDLATLRTALSGAGGGAPRTRALLEVLAPAPA